MFLFHIRRSTTVTVTDEDVRMMMQQGLQSGVFEPIEEEMVGRMFQLSDYHAIDLITHRSEIVWLDISRSAKENLKTVLDSGHSKYPVCRGGSEDIPGMIHARDLLAVHASGKKINMQSLLKPVVNVPEKMPVFEVMHRMREALAIYGACD